MVTINLSKSDNIESAIRRFRKEVERESIIRELKERQFYKKPSLIRRQEKIKLEKRLKRREKRRNYLG